MVNAVEFKAALSRYKAKQLPKIAKLMQQETAAELGKRIVRRTPVRTGLARGNTRLALGRRVAKRPTTQRDPSGNRTIAAIKSSARRIAAYSNWTIYNAVPYASRLENGYSRQSPRGMFRISMKEVVRDQKRIKNSVVKKLGSFNVR